MQCFTNAEYDESQGKCPTCALQFLSNTVPRHLWHKTTSDALLYHKKIAAHRHPKMVGLQ